MLPLMEDTHAFFVYLSPLSCFELAFFSSTLQFFNEYPALKGMNSRKIRCGTLCQHKQFVWKCYIKTCNTDAVMLEARYSVLV